MLQPSPFNSVGARKRSEWSFGRAPLLAATSRGRDLSLFSQNSYPHTRISETLILQHVCERKLSQTRNRIAPYEQNKVTQEHDELIPERGAGSAGSAQPAR